VGAIKKAASELASSEAAWLEPCSLQVVDKAVHFPFGLIFFVSVAFLRPAHELVFLAAGQSPVIVSRLRPREAHLPQRTVAACLQVETELSIESPLGMTAGHERRNCSVGARARRSADQHPTGTLNGCSGIVRFGVLRQLPVFAKESEQRRLNKGESLVVARRFRKHELDPFRFDTYIGARPEKSKRHARGDSFKQLACQLSWQWSQMAETLREDSLTD
jgi:hypothetical protein